MIIIFSILATAGYFTMGLGVFRMWSKIVDDGFALPIILFWPVILFITAYFKGES